MTNPFVCDPPEAHPTSPCDEADNQSWSRMVLTQRSDTVVRLSQAGRGGTQTSTPVTSTYSYGYHGAAADLYWSDILDFDVLDFYNQRFMGFATVTVTNPDGSREVHRFPSTLGPGVFDPNDPLFNGICTSASPCTKSPWWDPANADHGREIELDRYDTNGALV